MKKLTKTLLSVAAVSALTAAMAASASAMTATYADGTVTLADITATGASQTMIILNDDATTITDTTIVKAIDQKDDGSSFTTVPVGTLADGTYYVRIGGSEGTMQKVSFTVGEVTPPAGETEEIKIGDVNSDTLCNMSDATAIAQKSVGVSTEQNTKVGTERTTTDGTPIKVGDVNSDTLCNMSDATAVAQKSVGVSTEQNTKVGTTVEVLK